MIVALVLLGYGALLATVAPAVLRRGTWTARAPRLGIIAWQALSASLLSSLVLAGLVLVAPLEPLGTNLAVLLRTCLMAIGHGYANSGGVGVAIAGLVLAVGVVARSLVYLSLGLARSARERALHAQALRLVARRCEYPDTVVLDHVTPAAYCLPGRQHQVVLTSAALEVLNEAQLAAVLAHERAHLSGRHHLAVGAASALARAFPRVPLFDQAQREIARLVELAADDVAAARHGRLPVAAAMAAMASGPAPAMAMAAGGAGALERVRRLVSPRHPLSPGAVVGGIAIAFTILAIPALAAASPAVAAAGMPGCSMTAPTSVMVMGPGCHSPGMAAAMTRVHHTLTPA